MHTGKSVRLAPLQEAHRATLFQWINEREQVLSNAPYRPVHGSQHDQWFDAIQARRDAVIFAIVTLAADKLIGTCQLHDISALHRSAELQIRIGDVQERGRGYGREALGLLLRFAFKDLNLERVFLHVLAGNTRAHALYRTLGFVEEGRLRQAVFIDGARQDLVVMGILRAEHAGQ